MQDIVKDNPKKIREADAQIFKKYLELNLSDFNFDNKFKLAR